MVYMKNLIFKTVFLLAILGLCSVNNLFSQVCIGEGSPHEAAMLEIKSSDGGLLIPRMTTSSRLGLAIDAGSVSVLVFDTNLQKFMYWTGSEWLTLTPWDCNGELASDIQTSTNGKVGIGVDPSTSTEKLQVQGSIKAANDVIATNINASNNIMATNNITATNNVVANGEFIGFGTVPIGGIIMWNGPTTDFDTDGVGIAGTSMEGWALCYGNVVNGIQTPDLRSRFLAGYNPSDPNYDNIGYGTNTNGSVGAASVTLQKSQIPAHVHRPGTINITASGAHTHDIMVQKDEASLGSYASLIRRNQGGNEDVANDGAQASESQTHVHPSTSFAGLTENGSLDGLAGQAHENRPPYYVLAFIMRVQ
jgi:microcystin-dependent protein